MLALDEYTAKAIGFVSRKEQNPSRGFRVALEHKAPNSGKRLR
jgi:hypothetical protein